MQFAINLFVCAVLGAMRVYGVKDPKFQAVAHCYVAPLMAIGFMRLWPLDWRRTYYAPTRRYFVLAWVISLVELGTALHQRGFF